MYEIKKIKVLSFAKIFAIIMAAITPPIFLIYGFWEGDTFSLILDIGGTLGNIFRNITQNYEGESLLYYEGEGLLYFLLGLAAGYVIFTLISFLIGAIAAVIYNLWVNQTGQGIEIEIVHNVEEKKNK